MSCDIQDSYNFFVPEDVSVNTSLGKLLAFDSDEEQNGVIEFAIIAGDPRFRIITSEVDTSNSRQTFVGELYTDEVGMVTSNICGNLNNL